VIVAHHMIPSILYRDAHARPQGSWALSMGAACRAHVACDYII